MTRMSFPSRHRVGCGMFALFIAVAALMVSSVSVSATAASATATTGAQVCGGPLVITTGGTYSGCWIANQQGTAVTIATSAPVTITNSTIEGTTTLVSNSVNDVNI